MYQLNRLVGDMSKFLLEVIKCAGLVTHYYSNKIAESFSVSINKM